MKLDVAKRNGLRLDRRRMSNQNTKQDMFTITEPLVEKLIATIDAGLCSGLGSPKPGEMCVEAAVCYAMDLPHSDRPTCVGEAVRRFKIRLNDAVWSSNSARAQGMRNLAVAQLGSNTINQQRFTVIVAEKTIRRVLPVALRVAAKLNPKHAETLELAAKECEEKGTRESAKNARKAAYAAYAYAAADAAAAAYAAADADAARDEVLKISAEIGLEALIELESPGCEWLYLCES